MTSDHKVRLGEAALHMVLRKVKVDHGRAETRKQCPRTTAGLRMVLESASPWWKMWQQLISGRIWVQALSVNKPRLAREGTVSSIQRKADDRRYLVKALAAGARPPDSLGLCFFVGRLG